MPTGCKEDEIQNGTGQVCRLMSGGTARCCVLRYLTGAWVVGMVLLGCSSSP